MSTTNNLEQYIERRTDILATIEELKHELDEINAHLAANLDTGKQQIGKYTVNKIETRRIDTKQLSLDYPIDQYPSLYKESIDNAAVKNMFAPDALELYKTAPSVSFRIS